MCWRNSRVPGNSGRRPVAYFEFGLFSKCFLYRQEKQYLNNNKKISNYLKFNFVAQFQCPFLRYPAIQIESSSVVQRCTMSSLYVAYT